MFYIFSLRCANGSHYTGISSNVTERLNSTNDGRGPQTTRNQLPVRLAFTIGPFANHQAARVVSRWILPETSDRYQLLLRGDGAVLGRFGVGVKLGQEALEEALTNQEVSLSYGRAPARYKQAPSKEWGDTAGITLDLALRGHHPAQTADRGIAHLHRSQARPEPGESPSGRGQVRGPIEKSVRQVGAGDAALPGMPQA